MRRGCEKKKHCEAGREEVKVERRTGMRWRRGRRRTRRRRVGGGIAGR